MTMQREFHSALLAARMQGRGAVQALAMQHLPLVSALVKRFPRGLCEAEDLYQQGCIGLMKALLRFDPSQGVAFTTYAVPVILGEMHALLRSDTLLHIPRTDRELRSRIRRTAQTLSASLQREPTLQELASALRMDPADIAQYAEAVTVVSADAPQGDADAPLLDSLSCEDSRLAAVELRDIIAHLPEADRQLLHLRHVEGMTQAEAGHKLGLTQVQVSRREMLLRRQLRKAWYAT